MNTTTRHPIRNTTLALATLAALSFSGLAVAQSAPPVTGGASGPVPVRAEATVQRDVNQQKRIESGLQSGSLTTREAGALEREEAKVNHDQKAAMKDGKITAAEQARLKAEQDKVSKDIHTAKTNGVNGDPLSGSSQRMQGAVQRDVNQQQRVEAGLKDGSLTKREAAKLEGGQAHDERVQARAARNGHVGAGEAGAMNRAENHQSARIHGMRHNGQTRGASAPK